MFIYKELPESLIPLFKEQVCSSFIDIDLTILFTHYENNNATIKKRTQRLHEIRKCLN